MERIEIDIDDLVEVELVEDDDFLKIKETLTRIGISSRKETIPILSYLAQEGKILYCTL